MYFLNSSKDCSLLQNTQSLSWGERNPWKRKKEKASRCFSAAEIGIGWGWWQSANDSLILEDFLKNEDCNANEMERLQNLCGGISSPLPHSQPEKHIATIWGRLFSSPRVSVIAVILNAWIILKGWWNGCFLVQGLLLKTFSALLALCVLWCLTALRGTTLGCQDLQDSGQNRNVSLVFEPALEDTLQTCRRQQNHSGCCLPPPDVTRRFPLQSAAVPPALTDHFFPSSAPAGAVLPEFTSS